MNPNPPFLSLSQSPPLTESLSFMESITLSSYNTYITLPPPGLRDRGVFIKFSRYQLHTASNSRADRRLITNPGSRPDGHANQEHTSRRGYKTSMQISLRLTALLLGYDSRCEMIELTHASTRPSRCIARYPSAVASCQPGCQF